MRHGYLARLFLYLAATFLLSPETPVPPARHRTNVVSPAAAPQAVQKNEVRILERYGKLPLSFEVNQGQSDQRVKFLSRNGGYTLFLTQDEAVVALPGSKTNAEGTKFTGIAQERQPRSAAPSVGAVLRMKLRDANPAARITGMDKLPGTSNYFIGNDPSKWRSNVPTYTKVKYEEIYSGIDLVYYGNQRQLEYDFILAPGADPRRIAFEVTGAQRIRQDERGDLVLKLGDGEIRWHRPVVYQQSDGTRREIAARYSITAANRVGFEVAQYDPGRPLYIDPLIYSTFLGGSDAEAGQAIAVDNAGNAYVTGWTHSTDFPTTPGAFHTTSGGASAFVTKVNPSGSALVYSTYLGGSGGDSGSGVAVDSAGNAYVTGSTGSTNFPTTPGAFQTTFGGGTLDAYVTKLNPTGSALLYSTYLGGSNYDDGKSIAVDSSGNAYVTGSTESSDFPTTPGAFQTTFGGAGAFVTKVNPSGSALVYSTYLGSADSGSGIAVDSGGNAYVTGSTGSTNFPTTPGAFQTTFGGGTVDAYVTKLNPTGSALVYSTYLGGSGIDVAYAVAIDPAGNAYVTGQTASSDFPVTPGAFQTTFNGGCCDSPDAFVSKFNRSGSALVYSTYLGGNVSNYGFAIAVDSAGSSYVTGFTLGDFPVTPNAFQTKPSGFETPFVTKFGPSGSALACSTYLHGSSADHGNAIAVDPAGNAYVLGQTSSTDFPTTAGAFQTAYGGGAYDAFVAKIYPVAVTTTTVSTSLNPSTYGQAVTFTAVVTSALGAPPDGETVTFKGGTTVLGTGALSGGTARFSISTMLAGARPVTAVYGGDSKFAASTSKPLRQVVNKATTKTSLTSSQNPSSLGQSVTFTATAAPQFSGKPTGTVTFSDGATVLKSVSLSGGVAKFTTSTLTKGAHTITATYGGNSNFDGSSALLTQTVN